MKTIISFLLLASLHANASDVSDCEKSDDCKRQDCESHVVEQLGNTMMVKCQVVYKLRDGKHKPIYTELKMLSQRIEDKKSIMMGNTVRIPIEEK